MSKISDICSKMHGSVVPYILRGDEKELLPPQNNKILRTGNTALAHLLAGDISYSPRAVIFCGSNTNATPVSIDYDDSYAKLINGYSAKSAHILTRQVFDEDGDISVVFTASTGTVAGSPDSDLAQKYIKRAILCCKLDNVWIPFSAVNLTPIVQLPSGAYFGIHWNISISGN